MRTEGVDVPERVEALVLGMLSKKPEHRPEREESRRLLRVLQELPLETQLRVELHYWESFSDRELAALEGVPIGTIKSWLRKARAEIRQRLELASDPGSKPPDDSGPSSLESWAGHMRRQREDPNDLDDEPA